VPNVFLSANFDVGENSINHYIIAEALKAFAHSSVLFC